MLPFQLSACPRIITWVAPSDRPPTNAVCISEAVSLESNFLEPKVVKRATTRSNAGGGWGAISKRAKR